MKLAWIFSGQGAQSVGMGRDLYENSAAAKAVFDEADAVLGYSISDICFNGPDEKLTSSIYCQSAIYTMSMACLAAFRERYPDAPAPVAAAGLSLGEYAALAAAGYFSFADGLKLVTKRGALMDEACKLTNGSMASVIGGDPEMIDAVCKEYDIDVANYNCPGQTVISGPADRVEKAAADIKAKGAKRAIVLNVAGGFHSRLMATAGEALKPVLAEVPVSPLQIPVAQNVPGAIVADESVIKDNLAAQVAGSVRWESCVRDIIAKAGADAFIEFGPGNVLTGLVRRTVSDMKVFNVSGISGLDMFAAE